MKPDPAADVIGPAPLLYLFFYLNQQPDLADNHRQEIKRFVTCLKTASQQRGGRLAALQADRVHEIKDVDPARVWGSNSTSATSIGRERLM